MKAHSRTWSVLFSFSALILAVPLLNAQITNDIRAHINHSFMIDNTTLPPGQYTFRIMQNSDLQVMTAIGDDNKTSVTFVVREVRDDHTPAHSEVTFRKFGNEEFLNKIFEAGSKMGVAVTETGREEKHLVAEGQHATEHTEEQQ